MKDIDFTKIKMFKINNISPTQPYKIFIKYYLDKASFSGQSCIDAMSISSFNNELMEVDSRFVNLKYINGDEWIFLQTIILLKQ